MKNCQWCDAQFEASVSYQIYCSAECRDLATKEKISQRYAIAKRNKMIGKKRNCRACDKPLSAYNDETICHSCSVNPGEVLKALREIKGIAGGKPKKSDNEAQ